MLTPAEASEETSVLTRGDFLAALRTIVGEKQNSPAVMAPLAVGREDAARMLGIGTTLLDTQDAAGKLPEAVFIGARKLWRTADLSEWLRLGCPDRREFAERTADGSKNGPAKRRRR
ncbi:MAG: hypothetical protein AAF907_14720 [Planctomycetota bacterium]